MKRQLRLTHPRGVFTLLVFVLLCSGPAAGWAEDTTLVLIFTDGSMNNLAAKYRPEVSCADDDSYQVTVNPPDRFEEETTSSGGAPLEGEKGWGLTDLVESALMGAPLSFTVTPEGTTLRRGRRAGKPLELDPEKPSAFGEGEAAVSGFFRRSDLGLGEPYRAGDPLTLEETVRVELTVRCP